MDRKGIDTFHSLCTRSWKAGGHLTPCPDLPPFSRSAATGVSWLLDRTLWTKSYNKNCYLPFYLHMQPRVLGARMSQTRNVLSA